VTGTLVLKIGGELLEQAEGRSRIAAAVASMSGTRPVVVVHGGGRAIDADLTRRAIQPTKVEGLRVTDEATLEAVVSVLAGAANTELVSALVACGVRAVGLTGVDAGFARATRASAHRTVSGRVVDLGLVGDPDRTDTSLLELLLAHGYVPVVASLGVDADAQVLNVNADVMAGRVAAALAAAELVIAGATAGVLDDRGQSFEVLDDDAVEAIIGERTATAGMIAKLRACQAALADGVSRVRIVDGRDLEGSSPLDLLPGTTITLGGAILRSGKDS
jgi:acetylglutamate kinase